MSRYLEVASETKKIAQDLLAMVPEDSRPAAAEMVARIVNIAVRSCPRAVQHTIRLNIVRTAVHGLPVKVGMVEKTDERTGRTYHALTTDQLVAGHALGKGTVEPAGEEVQ